VSSLFRHILAFCSALAVLCTSLAALADQPTAHQPSSTPQQRVCPMEMINGQSDNGVAFKGKEPCKAGDVITFDYVTGTSQFQSITRLCDLHDQIIHAGEILICTYIGYTRQ